MNDAEEITYKISLSAATKPPSVFLIYKASLIISDRYRSFVITVTVSAF